MKVLWITVLKEYSSFGDMFFDQLAVVWRADK